MIIKCSAICSDEYDVPITEDKYLFWLTSNKPIQEIVPDIPPDMRELLISGTCPRCWDRMFKDDSSLLP